MWYRTCTRKHMHKCTYMSVYMHVYIHTHMYQFACMYVYILIQLCTSVYVYTYTCIHVHLNVHTSCVYMTSNISKIIWSCTYWIAHARMYIRLHLSMCIHLNLRVYASGVHIYSSPQKTAGLALTESRMHAHIYTYLFTPVYIYTHIYTYIHVTHMHLSNTSKHSWPRTSWVTELGFPPPPHQHAGSSILKTGARVVERCGTRGRGGGASGVGKFSLYCCVWDWWSFRCMCGAFGVALEW